jgi:hypothetical protein
METFLTLAIIIAIVVPILRFFMSRVPSASAGDLDRYKATLPEGFGYPYFLDRTGLAVSVKEKKLLITSGGRQHIYGLESIRGYKWRMNEADQFFIAGKASASAQINTGLKNRSLKKDAYRNSGIFVEVADIDTPVLQIRYSNEAELRRSVEILQQFMDGTLMDYDEYLERRQ